MSSRPFREFFAERTGLPQGKWHWEGEMIVNALQRFLDVAADYVEAQKPDTRPLRNDTGIGELLDTTADAIDGITSPPRTSGEREV